MTGTAQEEAGSQEEVKTVDTTDGKQACGGTCGTEGKACGENSAGGEVSALDSKSAEDGEDTRNCRTGVCQLL